MTTLTDKLDNRVSRSERRWVSGDPANNLGVLFYCHFVMKADPTGNWK